jgi:penicillin amidase
MLAEWDATYRRESAAAALYSFVSDVLPQTAREAATPEGERRTMLERALSLGLDSLRRDQGPDPAGWRWGRIHWSQLPHPLASAFDIPSIERDGGAGTVAATGATYRQIIDFANIDGSVVTNLPGQSAQPHSPFYANLTQSYANQEYFPLLFTSQAVDAGARHRLTLIPR